MKFIDRDQDGVIDMSHTMYPTVLRKISDSVFVVPIATTVYGVVLKGTVELHGARKILTPLEYFCVSTDDALIKVNGTAALIVRYGFRGQPVIGGPLEDSGRLLYIDNCSDSLLIYPPRQGDPSLSHLHFPPEITQRFHTHPSIRMGVIVRGEGVAENTAGMRGLTPGTCFCMEEREIHRFVTGNHHLDAFSFHPDGDWGPTDENHTLLNRTYGGSMHMQEKLRG